MLISVHQFIVPRAKQIKERDIVRFFEELNALDWNHISLSFHDEVGIDNRDMLRRRGYSLKVSPEALHHSTLVPLNAS